MLRNIDDDDLSPAIPAQQLAAAALPARTIMELVHGVAKVEAVPAVAPAPFKPVVRVKLLVERRDLDIALSL